MSTWEVYSLGLWFRCHDAEHAATCVMAGLKVRMV